MSHLTTAQSELLSRLGVQLTAGESSIVCHGTVSNSQAHSGPLRLFYVAAEGATRYADFPLSISSTKDLFDAAGPSDQHKSSSNSPLRELLPPSFALSSDIVTESTVLPDLMFHLDLSGRLVSRPQKLEIRGKGHVSKKPNKVSKDSAGQVGTLLLCLSGGFGGGNTTIITPQGSTELHWHDNPSLHAESIPWAFIPRGTSYLDLPVESGYRIMMHYDLIHDTQTPKRLMDSREGDVLTILRKLLDPKGGFTEEGCTIAFGLQHEYSAKKVDPKTNIPAGLKGVDVIVLDAIKELGLEPRGCSVIDLAEEEINQKWGKCLENPFCRPYAILPKYDPLGDSETYDESLFEHLSEKHNIRPGALWIAEPSSWPHESSYSLSGADCDFDCEEPYSYAMAIVVEIPPPSGLEGQLRAPQNGKRKMPGSKVAPGLQQKKPKTQPQKKR